MTEILLQRIEAIERYNYKCPTELPLTKTEFELLYLEASASLVIDKESLPPVPQFMGINLIIS